VYRLKQDKNGAVTRYKARFVAKGFRQLPRIDFHETFSPVVKSITIRAVLSLTVTNDWPLCQLDIQNAFLHENLKEQALFDLGFKGSKADPSLFICSREDTLLYILVDDVIVTVNNKSTIDNIICQLGSAFALKDLGPLNYFLGIEIVPHVYGILLFQKKCILELLQSAGLSNCNLVSSLMVTLSSLSLDDSTSSSNPSAVKRILRYLHGTVEHGMLIRCSSGYTLQAFTDVLWKGCEVYNLGTGKGTSVLELVSAFVKVSGKKIPLVKTGRRPGDAEIMYAATTKAKRELNWK
nr:hypothetical protein [Tanacetum cinerariifolium]